MRSLRWNLCAQGETRTPSQEERFYTWFLKFGYVFFWGSNCRDVQRGGEQRETGMSSGETRFDPVNTRGALQSFRVVHLVNAVKALKIFVLEN